MKIKVFMPKEIVLASGNPGKLKEFRQMLEPQIAALAARRISAKDLDRLLHCGHRICVVARGSMQSQANAAVLLDVWELQKVARVDEDLARSIRKVQRQSERKSRNRRRRVVQIDVPLGGQPCASAGRTASECSAKTVEPMLDGLDRDVDRSRHAA